MRLWHDNSGKGKFGGWYVNYVVVRDVQTKQRYQFVINQWLAVEEDDGQVSASFVLSPSVCLSVCLVTAQWQVVESSTMHAYIDNATMTMR